MAQSECRIRASLPLWFGRMVEGGSKWRHFCGKISAPRNFSKINHYNRLETFPNYESSIMSDKLFIFPGSKFACRKHKGVCRNEFALMFALGNES